MTPEAAITLAFKGLFNATYFDKHGGGELKGNYIIIVCLICMKSTTPRTTRSVLCLINYVFLLLFLFVFI